jgi:hypothetical protein
MSYNSTPPYFFVACTGTTLTLTDNWFVYFRISLTCWFSKKREYSWDTLLVILNLSIRWELKRCTVVMPCYTLDEIHTRQQNSIMALNLYSSSRNTDSRLEFCSGNWPVTVIQAPVYWQQFVRTCLPTRPLVSTLNCTLAQVIVNSSVFIVPDGSHKFAICVWYDMTYVYICQLQLG